ncbi:ferrochelatase [Pseudemcibacter aquimaris]|uniref:ferrochelatase n=1 Tax=Pseudemcibacter aquimaris TaxID=2857064 RepID=UPI002013A168|nr:ferrochelatase [Pseudemcibacter aquimaris]MCC3861830.1 ferrochelatase [Pseudemcibacter aquimaris]WDU58585.1 ferrochelatase [Pseudemcibacter aquimaris]
MSKKCAVVMFNLGGPDNLDAVKPFLFNLFYDPAIISVPNPLRWMIAKTISSRRAPIARNIYREIGNKSPILEETEKQRVKLENILNNEQEDEYKCFIFMRYWKPFAKDVVKQVKEYNPDEIILLPLYPQYSITTTGTGIIEWNKCAKKEGLISPYRVIKEYPDHKFFVETMADMIREKLANVDDKNAYRLLLSAHGLPKKTIENGDPYQTQVEQTCAALMEVLKDQNLDHVVCYQSRVGPLEWIGPSTEDEIERAGVDGKNIIMVPVAFVSEHSETLVELDIEYKELADEAGIKDYVRIDTVQDRDKFIDGLASLVTEHRI